MAGVKRNIQEMYNSHTNGNNNNQTNGNMMSSINNTNGSNQMNIDMNNENSTTNQNEAKKTRLDNQTKQEPSRVVHLRNIPHQLTENEIIFLGLSFGNIKNVLFLRSKNQAFLEFEQLQDAQQMILHFNNSSTTFSGKKIFVQYSNHQELNTDPSNSNNLVAQAALNEAVQLHKSAKLGGKNTVLRATILNMIYPVTLDVLHQIFSKFGNVLKIITFNKNDKFQVLIQIKDPMSAQNAKMSLHGQNIYNGCCTLQIDFSKLTTLEVRFNNDKSRDYTNLLLPTGDGSSGSNNQSHNMNTSLSNLNDISMSSQQSHNSLSSMNGNNHHGGGGGGISSLQYQQQQQSLIGTPPNMYGNMPAQNGNNHPNQMNPFSSSHHMSNSLHQQQNNFNQMNMNNHQMGGGGGVMQPPHHNQHQNNQQMGGQNGSGNSAINTPVLLVSNLNEEFVTPEALFTLFGVYGDVLRVKILFNKKDSALINFSNGQQAATALSNLDRVKLWNKQIRVFPSKHLTVQMPKDGQPDSGLTKDFSNSPLHRFKKPGSKNFNNIFPPSQTLHLSNIPPNVTEQELRDLFGMYGSVKAFKFFQKDRKMALLQMETVEEAITALIATHNYQLADNMHLRCTFSKATI
jgi:polypyrimidine tract-binding protein 1